MGREALVVVRGVGRNTNLGGQTLNRKYETDNYVIVSAFGQPKPGWANDQPTHPAPTLLLVCTAGVYHSLQKVWCMIRLKNTLTKKSSKIH